jgi:hypothetical protein
LLKDPTEGKEILDDIRETTPLIDLHNDVPSGGERIEQRRTIVSIIQAFISIISKILLKVPILNSRNHRKRALHANPTTQIPLCYLLNFPRDHVSVEVEEGVVGRRGSFFMTHLFQPQCPGRGTVRKPIMFPCHGNI